MEIVLGYRWRLWLCIDGESEVKAEVEAEGRVK